MQLYLAIVLVACFQYTTAQGLPCTTTQDCDPFDVCALGVCIPDFSGCPNSTCPFGQVCARGRCIEFPVPRRCRANNNADCQVFEFCSQQNECVPDHRNCPGGCRPDEVCVNMQCRSHPLRPQPMTTTAAATAVAPRATCPAGWFSNPTFRACYLVQHGSFTYRQADANCRVAGGFVSSVSNAAEMVYINGLTGGVPFWIGGRKHNNIWFWQDGRTPFGFTNWRGGEPDNCCGADVSCILVNFQNRNGQWDDAGCDDRHRPNQAYVCKRFL